MLGYHNPKNTAYPIRVNFSVQDAQSLRYLLGASLGEWGDKDHEHLIGRLAHELNEALERSKDCPEKG